MTSLISSPGLPDLRVPNEPCDWQLLDSGLGDPAWNMALDEVLFETALDRNLPLLRFYGWSEPAVTFGYSQSYKDVLTWTSLRPAIRRPTGGGLVPHDHDWTYTVVIPPAHEWYALTARESYHRVHEWVRRSFARLDIPAKLAPATRKDLVGQCFTGAEQFDVICYGIKIAGAAQRRNRLGLLIQGSVQPPFMAPERAVWQQSMLDVAATDWGVTWTPWPFHPTVPNRASQLAMAKYSRADYNQKR